MKPNPECPVCHGTGYPPGSKHPCDCWGYYTDLTSGHDAQHDDRGRWDELERLYGATS
jgi:hypothetical protein